jgi:hypothetical protein
MQKEKINVTKETEIKFYCIIIMFSKMKGKKKILMSEGGK